MSDGHGTVKLEFLTKHNIDEGLDQNLDVKPPGTMLQVVKVEFQSAQHLLHRVGIAVVKGGIAGDPWTNLIKIGVARISFYNLLDVELTFRAWADKGHVALHHIPQLGKLV